MADQTEPDTSSWGCYRHPYEEAGVRCTRCDRAICPQCMITAPVGFQCPECVKSAPPVHRYREIRSTSSQQIAVTLALIAVNVALFIPSMSNNQVLVDFGLHAFPIDHLGEWYRLVTAGFLHFNILHIGFNMFILYQLGQQLEPALGRVRYGLLYFAALLGGSVGALVVSPNALTAGASGAVFGLMGALAVSLRSRGINIMQTSIGSLLVLNLVLTFAIRGISIGGHLGGLAAGALAGVLLDRTERQPTLGTAAVGVLALVLVGAGILIA